VDAQNINWLIYPESQVQVTLIEGSAELPLLEVTGNPRGFASLAGIFLWLSSLTEGHEFLSITALPFVSVQAPLAFSIELSLGRPDQTQGRIVRLDKHQQFEWQVDDETLERIACNIHAIACRPAREYLDISVAEVSAAQLAFRLTSSEQ
jgi:hypothetical protein